MTRDKPENVFVKKRLPSKKSADRVLDVHAYLEDVLRRALAGETDWATMAPHAWKPEHPESIRQYRQDERRQAADRKRVRRARRRVTEA